ncbi:MAG TPA: chemotaxis protein CheW, partial [Thermoanaerobaculia bacterium]
KKVKEKEEATAANAAQPQEPPHQSQPAPQQQATQAAPLAENPQTPNAQSPTPSAPIPTPDSPPTTPLPTTQSINKLDRFKQDAGKRRAFQTIEDAEEETAHDQLELLTFVIAKEHYAVDIEHIVEIVTPRAVTRIPNADPSVVGIMSLRGTIVTLVDVRKKLRHAAAGEATADTRIVVIEFQHEIVGFLVDRVLRVVKTSRAAIEPHPVVHATELEESIRGVFRAGGALTILLDLDKLLDHKALAATTA